MVPRAKQPGGGRNIQAAGAIVRERAGLKPAGIRKFAAPQDKVGRLDFALKVEGAVATETVRRGPPPIRATSR